MAPLFGLFAAPPPPWHSALTNLFAAPPPPTAFAAIASFLHPDSSLCGRYPSVCDGTHAGNVLSLSGRGLDGSLPKDLGRLTRLTSLDLSHNNFGGTIPTQLAQLTSLESLKLTGNQLSGSCQPSSAG